MKRAMLDRAAGRLTLIAFAIAGVMLVGGCRRPCKTATSSMNTDQTWQLGMVRTPRFVCNDAQFLGVLRT